MFLAGCVQIRYLTYPDSFTWIGEEDVKTSMQAMGKALSQLNRLVERETILGENRTDILLELENIEYLSASLALGAETNHQLLHDNIEEFLDSILRARIQVESNPPNYYGIGQLTGSCSSCHRLR